MSDEIKKQLEEISAQPEVKTKLMDILTSKKPLGWGRKSVAPYYKEKYAKEMQEMVDQQLINQKPIVFRHSIWCNDNTGMSPRTLYARITQGIKYLIEKMDPNDKYSTWWQNVTLQRLDNAIYLTPSDSAHHRGQLKLTPEFVVPREEMPEWQRKMEEWLESTSEEPFVLEKILLTEEEVLKLRQDLNAIEGIMADVTFSSIKIVRINI